MLAFTWGCQAAIFKGVRRWCGSVATPAFPFGGGVTNDVPLARVRCWSCGRAAMTVSLGIPSLSGRVAITEPVTVSCSPFDPSLVAFGQSVTVNAEQASGRSIARGSGTSANSFACDGSQTTVPVSVLADPAGPPFHGGPAVISASAQASAGTPCAFAPPGSFTSRFESQNASAGPAVRSAGISSTD